MRATHRVYPFVMRVNPKMQTSTTKEENAMELLILSLTLAALATIGQLRDAVGGNYGAGRA